MTRDGLCWVATWLIFMAGEDVVFRSAGVDGDYVPSHCWPTPREGVMSGELRSPGWPGQYLNNTECLQVIQAPVGHRIRLEFLDTFHIEVWESCDFDYLEMRDGPFGYSPLIGVFCGDQTPPLKITNTRFLWLRFKSDDTIQYDGFRLSYTFIRAAPTDSDASSFEVCQINIDPTRSQGNINASSVPNKFIDVANRTEGSFECTWIFRLPPRHRVWFRWPLYDMTTPADCDDSFLAIYEKTTSDSDRFKIYCGDVAKDAKATSNYVFLRLYVASLTLMPTFNAQYTIFVQGPCTGDDFACGDGSCIDRSLVCNGLNNCNSGADESVDPSCMKTLPAVTTTPSPKKVGYHSVILGIVGGIIVTVITLGIVVTCWQKNKEDARHRNALQQTDRRIEVEMTNLLHQTPTTRRSSLDGVTQNHVGAVTNPANHIPSSSSYPRIANHSGERKAERSKVVYPESSSTRPVSGGFVDSGAYKCYLDVGNYNDGEHTAPEPVSTVVTIEKQPLPRMYSLERKKSSEKHARNLQDRSPSPRPDVVQEERFVYATRKEPLRNGHGARRRFSDDTILGDKIDIWKPMTPDLGDYASSPHLAASNKREGSFKRPKTVQNAVSAPGINQVPKETSFSPGVSRRPITDQSPRIVTSSRTNASSSRPLPDGVDPATHVPGSYPYSRPRANQQVVDTTNTSPERNNIYATPTHRYRKSPKPQKRSTAESPKTPKRVSSKSPEIFYTRPNLNPGSRSVQRFYQV